MQKSIHVYLINKHTLEMLNCHSKLQKYTSKNYFIKYETEHKIFFLTSAEILCMYSWDYLRGFKTLFDCEKKCGPASFSCTWRSQVSLIRVKRFNPFSESL